tara:strand:+ start:515 stop:787 length:273 start_codon:yes stop_codon:yes gene_type:complete
MSEDESEGLGDTVEKIITKIGDVTEIKYIKRKKGCSGCRKRKEWLNKHFPYRHGEEAPHNAPAPTPEPPCTDCEKKKKAKGGCKSCGKNK